MLELRLVLYLKKLRDYIRNSCYIKETCENNKIYCDISFLFIHFKLRKFLKEYTKDIAKTQIATVSPKITALSKEIEFLKTQIININPKITALSKEIEFLKKENDNIRIFLDYSVDITKIRQAEGSLRTHQLLLTKIIELVKFVCDKNDILLWPGYGTLIGAIRHKGFVPWDNDVDLCILKKDLAKLDSAFRDVIAFNSDFNFSYYLYDSYLPRIHYKSYTIDIFPYEYTDKYYETSEQKNEFVLKWRALKREFNSKYWSDFSSINTKLPQIDKGIAVAKKVVLGREKTENFESGQIIMAAEYVFVAEKCEIIDTCNLFPLKESEFENININIPNNSIEFLYQMGLYGQRGDIMRFPKIAHSGSEHIVYSWDSENLEKNYAELSALVNEYCKKNN